MDKKIMIVDDEESVLNALKRLFRKQPYDVRFALSGESALEMLAEEPADLVISDMRMPRMDGAELLSKVKEQYPQTKRILLSGYSDEESIKRAIGEVTVFGFLTKPWNQDELLSVVKDALTDS